jgi:tartrate-resistant acid phosphatase type 5
MHLFESGGELVRGRVLGRTVTSAIALAIVAEVTLPLVISARLLPAQQRDTMQLIAPSGALSFIAMGDWGRQGEFNQRAVAAQMAKAARRLDAAFILALGDNFYPNGVQSVNDPQWRTSFEDVYTAHALHVDWYVALGNHDYDGNPQAQVDYSQISRRWRLPARYYAFREKVADGVDAEFFVLDTSPFITESGGELQRHAVPHTDTTAQRKWLDSALTASTAKWKFIVGHHPVYGHRLYPVIAEMERLLVPRLAKYGVAAYISGHEHRLQHILPAGSVTHYFVSGAASETVPGARVPGARFVSSQSGFFAMSLTRDSLIVQAVDDEGRMLYRAALTKR